MLSIKAGNFTPGDVEQFLNVSWSLAPEFVLDPGKNIAATLRLDVSLLVHDITDFSFDFTVWITEAAI